MMDRRWAMMLAGGGFGLLIRLLNELPAEGIVPDRAATALVMLASGVALAFLALAGPLRLRAAAGGGLAIGAVATALFVLAALRFSGQAKLEDMPGAVAAFAATVLLAVPPWIARSRGSWCDYPTLFHEAWGVVIRTASALAFLGVVWAVIALSDALLKLVGLPVLDPLWDNPVLGWTVSGAAVGLALAMIGDRPGADLALRLVRLLLPVVLAVILVFLVALPMRGLSGLVGEFSAAGALLAMCAAAILLVTLALGRNEAQAVATPAMRLCTWGLATILCLPAGLALWSVLLRVGDYGWTPQRLMAVTGAGGALVVALVWLLALLRGRGWAARIRQANVWLGVGVLALAALWQTPLLNAEAISARSQAARIATGAEPDTSTLRRISEWGKPGAALLARLEEGAEGDLALRLQQMRGTSVPVTADDFAALVPVRPLEAEAVGRAMLHAAAPDLRSQWAAICRNGRPAGQPGCVLVVGRFHTDDLADQAVLIGKGAQGLEVQGLTLSEGRLNLIWVEGSRGEGDALLSRALAGEFAMEPVPEQRLRIGGRVLSLGG